MQYKKCIAYASCQLKVHERSYLTLDLKLAALVFDLRIWPYYSYGFNCEVFTKHRSLHQVFTQKYFYSTQRRWMELLNDYYVTSQYHPCKENFVAHTMNRKAISMGSLAHFSGTKQLLAKEIQTLEFKFVQFGVSERGGLLASIETKSIII